MKFVVFSQGGRTGLAIESAGGDLRGRLDEAGAPAPLPLLIAEGMDALRAEGRKLAQGQAFDPAAIAYLPPLASPEKILCIGLNYHEHVAEGGGNPQTPQEYPVIFLRVPTSLIGHKAPILKPRVSDRVDWECEMVAVIGKGGRAISKANALDHVIGYSIFNDVSIRDYQRKTTQWTMGKNFDATGPFGPCFVTADELPPGGRGLKIETRINGAVMQSSNTEVMIFDVPTLVETISEGMTLKPGDIIVTGTPGGVGNARKPPIYMKAGDLCEIALEGVGALSNPVIDER